MHTYLYIDILTALHYRLSSRLLKIKLYGIEDMPHVTVGLALGGGVARSFANIGVLNVLAREDIGLDCIVGTSAASIIGAVYASGVSIRGVNEIALHTRWKDLAYICWWKPLSGILSSENITKFLEKHCRCKFFEEVQIPYGVIVTDLMTGAERLFTSGEIAPVVGASCSIPGIFQPVRIGKRVYIDGCYVNQIPASAARRMGADIVIGCDVSKGALAEKKKIPRNVFAVLRHLVALHSQKTADKGRRESDVLVQVKVSDIGLTQLHRCEHLIQRGEKATEAILPLLQNLIARRQQ